MKTRIQLLWLALWLVVALGIRLQVSLQDRTLPTSDGASYDALAVNLAEGKGYRDGNGDLTAYWMPGYPIFLASVYRVAGHDYRPVRVIQAVLSTLTVLGIGLWAFILFGRGSGSWAVAIAALYPAFYKFYYSSSSILSETLYVFFLTLAFTSLYAYWRAPSKGWALISGCFWGLSIFIRPIPLGFLGVLPFIFMASRYPFRSVWNYTFVVWGMVALLLSPWVLRNYRVFGEFVPVATNGGPSFYMSNHLGSDGLGGDFLRGGIRVEDDRLRAEGVSEPGRAKYFYRKGLEFIREHPQEALRLFVRKFLLYMDPTVTLYSTEENRRVINGGFLVVLTGAGIAFLLGFREKEFLPSLLSLSVVFAYFALLHAVFNTSHRYRFPLEPILIVMTAFALDWVRRKLVRPKKEVLL